MLVVLCGLLGPSLRPPVGRIPIERPHKLRILYSAGTGYAYRNTSQHTLGMQWLQIVFNFQKSGVANRNRYLFINFIGPVIML